MFGFVKNKTKEKKLTDIFTEQIKKGAKTYNLFNFYQLQYNIEEIVSIIKSHQIPFGMEFKRDQDTMPSITGYTGGSRYPDYSKNFVKVFILDDDYENSIRIIEEIKQKFMNKKYGLDGIIFFYKDN